MYRLSARNRELILGIGVCTASSRPSLIVRCTSLCVVHGVYRVRIYIERDVSETVLEGQGYAT